MKKQKFSPLRVNETNRIIIGKRELFNLAVRETCLFRDELFYSWLLDNGTELAMNIPIGNSHEYILDRKSFFNTLHYLEKDVKNIWDKHDVLYGELKYKMLNAAKDLGEAAAKGDKKQIINHYKKFNQSGYDFCYFIWSPWVVIQLIEEKMLEKYQKETDVIMGLEQPDEYLKMERDLFLMDEEDLVKMYSWLKVYSTYDKPFTATDFKKLKKEVSKQEIDKKYARMDRTKDLFRKLLSRIKDNSDKINLKLLHKYAWLRTDRVDVWKKSMYYLIPFMNYIVNIGDDIDIYDVSNMSSYEILQVLENDKFPSKLKERRKRNLYAFHKNKINLITDKNEIEKIHENLQNFDSVKDEIIGKIACQGNVKGIVKIIGHSEDLSKIKKGDVMVAKYTFPNFTPYMLKCSAIVTDEGGSISHAAIVGREHNIPCIVGTKIATKVFRDGDLVEVDANKGIVRKVK